MSERFDSGIHCAHGLVSCDACTDASSIRDRTLRAQLATAIRERDAWQAMAIGLADVAGRTCDPAHGIDDVCTRCRDEAALLSEVRAALLARAKETK